MMTQGERALSRAMQALWENEYNGRGAIISSPVSKTTNPAYPVGIAYKNVNQEPSGKNTSNPSPFGITPQQFADDFSRRLSLLLAEQ